MGPRLMTRLQFFDRDVKVMLAQDLGQEAVARQLAATARAGLAEYLGSLSDPPTHVTVVNGRRGAMEDAVKPPGPILYEFSWWGPVLGYALPFLRARSPQTSSKYPWGHRRRHTYRDSFFVMENGREVQPSGFDMIDPGAEVTIGNDAPYSRKLDVQLIGLKPVKVSVPPGIFKDAAEAVRAKFGQLIDVRHVYNVTFRGGYILLDEPREGKQVHSPALVLNAKQ
jgi:hypothetical protein